MGTTVTRPGERLEGYCPAMSSRAPRRRWRQACTLALATSAMTALVAAPAGGQTTPHVSGTFSVTWAGVTGAGSEQPPAAAKWSFGFAVPASTDGDYPAALVSVGQDAVTQPCADYPDGGSIITRVADVDVRAARVNVVPYLDIRRGTGHVVLRPSRADSGSATRTTDRECAAPYDGENGVSTESVPASALFGDIITPRPWRVRRAADGIWRGTGSQTLSNGVDGYAPQVQTADIRLAGSAVGLHALCRIPTNHQLRLERTARAARQYLASAGLPRAHLAQRASYQVPAGRYFVLERDTETYWPCGPQSVTLVRSTGRPAGGGGAL